MMNSDTINIMMMIILTINLMTTKTSIMCINMILYILTMTINASMKIKMSPMPFIVFLTMIGGLMIIFLYLASTLWMKKESLTLKTKVMLTLNILIPLSMMMKYMNLSPNQSKMIMFDHNFNLTTITLIFLLNIMLMFVIEIHIKMNMPFRRKLKIWG